MLIEVFRKKLALFFSHGHKKCRVTNRKKHLTPAEEKRDRSVISSLSRSVALRIKKRPWNESGHINLLSFFTILIQALSSLGPYSTGYFRIYESHVYRTNLISSMFETRPLISASAPTVADCAVMRLNSIQCRTALFSATTNICILYSEDAIRAGPIHRQARTISLLSTSKDLSIMDPPHFPHSVH